MQSISKYTGEEAATLNPTYNNSSGSCISLLLLKIYVEFELGHIYSKKQDFCLKCAHSKIIFTIVKKNLSNNISFSKTEIFYRNDIPRALQGFI